MKIAYLCDSGTGRSIDYFKEKGIFSLPLQLACDNKTYQDMENMDNQACIDLLKQKKVLTTSLPSYGLIDELFAKLKQQNYEKVIAVPICSGLSSTISALCTSAAQYGLDIKCYDTYVTAVVEEYLIEKIKYWTEHDLSETEIDKRADEVIASCDTLLLPVDLDHLKRGGRLSPQAALLAGLLKIVPILRINKATNGKIDTLNKVRTKAKAISTTIEYMKKANIDESYLITVAHVDCEMDAQKLAVQLQNEFPNTKIQVIKLCNTVSAHTGLNCLAIQYFKQID